MRITSVETVLLTGPCTNDPFLGQARHRRSAAFIEIHTDTQWTGLGETYAGYFCPEIVPEIVDFFAPILVGQNVDDIDELWRRMYRCGNFWCRVGLGAIVLSGIEAALWDLRGKIEGKPVHALLGGRKHDRLPGYATGGPSNYPKSELVRKLDHYLSLGFRGVKLGAGAYSQAQGFRIASSPAEAADFEADKMAFVCAHVGDNVMVMLDGHMDNSPDVTWDLETARAVADAVAAFNPFFIEEPLPYNDPAQYRALREHSPVPIAGGECLTTCVEWRTFIGADAFDIGQPDASFIGGLGEFTRVSAMLEQRGHKIATHAWGAGGSLMQNVHCGFACPNTVILEVPPDYGPLHAEIMRDSFVMRDGFVLPPEKPGLGIVLTDDVKRRFPFVPGSGEFNSVPGKIMPEALREPPQEAANARP
ncbi:MAG: mandelate racemase/muconate lactonizing enzyme family protein [Phycisphaerae bacterium]|nr:mandelate racemase/muconate lactonizing enzyme family protein [Phycisphaerae bacterium]